MPRTIDQSARPVIFGEVLFDHYPDGTKLLGGAAFNVAWHLQGFGLRPIFVTRLGQDVEGELALTDIIRWGMDTRTVQIDHQHKTGSVIVSQTDNDNQFEIESNQAWDFINSALAIEWLKHFPCSLIYAGSLAQRNPVSHKTLQRIILETQLSVFIDINLRPPWTDKEIINMCLQSAHWLKVNQDEIAALIGKKLNTPEELQAAALKIRADNDIGHLYITQGDQGGIVLNDHGIKQFPTKSITAVDTIGAGDAFSAIVILGLHYGWSDFQIIKNANEFATCVCEGLGGTPLKQKDYDEFLTRWT